MRYKQLQEAVGKIVPGVNTTVDVGPGQTEIEAAKFFDYDLVESKIDAILNSKRVKIDESMDVAERDEIADMISGANLPEQIKQKLFNKLMSLQEPAPGEQHMANMQFWEQWANKFDQAIKQAWQMTRGRQAG